MDFLKNQFGNQSQQQQQSGEQAAVGNQPLQTGQTGQEHTQTGQQSQAGFGGFMDSLKNKANAAAGGGRESEKNEDVLDKGVDFVQEKFLGQGKQDEESAFEQAKDEQISDFIRGKYKSTAGTDFPIKDKPTTFDR